MSIRQNVLSTLKICMIIWIGSALSESQGLNRLSTNDMTCIESASWYLGFICKTKKGSVSSNDLNELDERIKKNSGSHVFSVIIVTNGHDRYILSESDKAIFGSPEYWLKHSGEVDTSGFLASMVRIGDVRWTRMRSGEDVEKRCEAGGMVCGEKIDFEVLYLYGTAVRPESQELVKSGVVFILVPTLEVELCKDARNFIRRYEKTEMAPVRCKAIPQFFREMNFYSVFPFATRAEREHMLSGDILESIICWSEYKNDERCHFSNENY